MSNELPAAGWYPNPDGTGGLRWWSGVGWSEYIRSGPAQPLTPVEAAPADHPAQSSAWTTDQQATTWPTQAHDEAITQSLPAPTNAWQPGPTQADPVAPLGGYGAYSPPPPKPLTGSGMRPVSALFSDIGRITKRAWWPILAISAIIWTLMSALLAVASVTLVDVTALRRGFDFLGTAINDSPDGNLSDAQLDQLSTDFGDAFGRIPIGAWVLIGVVFGVLMLLASTVQIGAVNRLAMDATTANQISWGGAWKSGFTAGFRLFGYYVLIMVLSTIAIIAVTIVIVLAAQLAPALAVALGVLALLGGIAVAVLLTGRLMPTLAQAVVGGRALSWSWRATKGKFWAVLGRYILWSLVASVLINVVLTVVSLPVSLVVLGQGTTDDPFSQLGLALTLNLLLLPVSMATAAITIIGIVPIWRDLTDHPVYRSIDHGVPVPAPTD